MNKNNLTSGFTIIEVLIVLAIAGLIILIVFLAVPALQRNTRNNERNRDAARMAAAFSECIANNRGRVESCTVESTIFPYIGAEFEGDTIVLKDNLQLTSIGAAGLNSFESRLEQRCNSEGNETEVGTSKNIAILWQNETSAGNGTLRCININ